MDKRIKIIKEGELGTRPSWDEYFMKQAIDAARRSSCHHVNAGCVIVEPKTHLIIGTGYNGAAPGLKNCLEIGCQKESMGLQYEESLNTSTCIGIHAEMNALGHLTKRDRGIIAYNTIFPCHSCAKNMLPYNPERIVFKGIYSQKEFDSTIELFQRKGIEVVRLNISPERVIDLDLNWPEVDFGVWSPKERKRISRILGR